MLLTSAYLFLSAFLSLTHTMSVWLSPLSAAPRPTTEVTYGGAQHAHDRTDTTDECLSHAIMHTNPLLYVT